jgi:glycosyltransferase involved in cell wall biosynthesis
MELFNGGHAAGKFCFTMTKVYIIFSTIDIGGAEKRFTGLWRSFQTGNNKELKVNVVMNPQLHSRLLEMKEINSDHNTIFVTKLQGTNFLSYRKNVQEFIKNQTAPNDIIHFIGISPLLRPYKRKILFSLTNSNLNSGRSNKTVILLSSLLANALDVLDPDIFKKINTLFFWKKIFRTPNSFCDTQLFSPVPFNQKKNWIVFLGRFTPVKQIEQIVKALPLIDEKLKAMGQHDVKFFLLGYGKFTAEINSLLESSTYRSLPLTIRFEKEPQKILNASKVFLSLQLYNNYPSKSLLEAMAAGNIPLVTDVGQTRWLAKPDFSYYIPEHFTKEELAEAITKVFSMNDMEWEQKMNRAREIVMHNHTLEKMKKYYEQIYTSL